jgi:hypothetical protein
MKPKHPPYRGAGGFFWRRCQANLVNAGVAITCILPIIAMQKFRHDGLKVGFSFCRIQALKTGLRGRAAIGMGYRRLNCDINVTGRNLAISSGTLAFPNRGRSDARHTRRQIDHLLRLTNRRAKTAKHLSIASAPIDALKQGSKLS